ncbi:MAG: tail fiber domain-containing protein, partial [Candidatus Thorarchaeota archaeon]
VGATWLDTAGDSPVGIYYYPRYENGPVTQGGEFSFWTQNKSGSRYETFKFGYDTGATLATEWGGISLTSTDAANDIRLTSSRDIDLDSGDTITLDASDRVLLDTGGINRYAQVDILQTTPIITLKSYDSTGITTSTTVTIEDREAKISTTRQSNSAELRVDNTGDTGDTGDPQIHLDIGNGTNFSDIQCAAGFISLNAQEGYLDLTSSGTGTYIRLNSSTGDYRFTNTDNTGAPGNNAFWDGDNLRELTSSRRHKDNIKLLEDVSWVYDLKPSSFTYKNQTRTNYGLIAEEVLKVNKDLVVFDNRGRPHGVAYTNLTSILLKAIQDQKEEIDWLKAELDKKSNKRVYKKKK